MIEGWIHYFFLSQGSVFYFPVVYSMECLFSCQPTWLWCLFGSYGQESRDNRVFSSACLWRHTRCPSERLSRHRNPGGQLFLIHASVFLLWRTQPCFQRFPDSHCFPASFCSSVGMKSFSYSFFSTRSHRADLMTDAAHPSKTEKVLGIYLFQRLQDF